MVFQHNELLSWASGQLCTLYASDHTLKVRTTSHKHLALTSIGLEVRESERQQDCSDKLNEIDTETIGTQVGPNATVS